MIIAVVAKGNEPATRQLNNGYVTCSNNPTKINMRNAQIFRSHKCSILSEQFLHFGGFEGFCRRITKSINLKALCGRNQA